ncbi:NfeD family protein [Georgenia sp. SYP-B2076]|uniref:NfeD family protein n=1 Tax=Georgenia sp. SYP-B2076 TaxID=2495881 RepID=UPI0013DF69D7|nr:NfeD family protein [Georgenia sp. SYP-B2076]
MTAFLIIGGIGLLVLVVSLTVGEIFDAFDSLEVGLSSSALGAALTTLGTVGVLATSLGASALVAALVAVAAGAVAAFIVQKAITALVRSGDGDTSYDVVGLEGSLTATTGPASGQVRLDDPREVESRLAWSDTELAPGTRVRVVSRAGARVKVTAV